MKGMEPSVVSAKAEQFFEHNLKEEYPTINGSPEQVRNLAAFQSGQKLQSTGTRTVLAVRIILNDGLYNYAFQTGLSNDIFGNGVNLHNLNHNMLLVCSISSYSTSLPTGPCHQTLAMAPPPLMMELLISGSVSIVQGE